jgi:hypothetical protein
MNVCRRFLDADYADIQLIYADFYEGIFFSLHSSKNNLRHLHNVHQKMA